MGTVFFDIICLAIAFGVGWIKGRTSTTTSVRTHHEHDSSVTCPMCPRR